jgi:hypothetical protein
LLKRLNDWNTMPTWERYSAGLVPAAEHVFAVCRGFPVGGGHPSRLMQPVAALHYARTGGADDADHIPAADGEVDIPQHPVGAEGL